MNELKKLASLNVTPLVRSIDSFEVLEQVASESHVIIHNAESASHLPSAQAIVFGLNKRIKMIGQSAIYIHTSGTRLIVEDVRDGKGSHKVYNDVDSVQTYDLPDE